MYALSLISNDWILFDSYKESRDLIEEFGMIMVEVDHIIGLSFPISLIEPDENVYNRRVAMKNHQRK